MSFLRKIIIRLLSGGAIAVLAVAGVAEAQTAASDTEQPVAATSKNVGLEEIVVTAQRRRESLQDVPISISAITAAGAEQSGIKSSEDLGIAIPALQFNRQGGVGGTPFIRGVGTAVAQNGTESPVAVYVDDVYMSSPVSTIFDLNNLEGVEVLKGPQGTLFGRNATGGVVNIHTKEPTQDPSLDATVGYGSYDTSSTELYANGPLSKAISANIDAFYKDQSEGYGRDIVTGQSVWKEWNEGVRGKLSWQISDDTKLLFAADYSHDRNDLGWNLAIAPGSISAGGTTYHCPFCTATTPLDGTENWVGGASVRVDHDFGNMSLVSITAFRDNRQSIVLDADEHLPGTPIILIIPDDKAHSRSTSQEFRLLSSDSDTLKWIVGAFYFHQESGFDPLTYSGLAFSALGGSENILDSQNLNSYSVFGETSYKFQSDTKITAGLRYTDDYFNERVQVLAGGVEPVPLDPSGSAVRFAKLTYRAMIDQKLNEDSLLYASYSRGFRSGEYSSTSPTEIVNGAFALAPPVKPEVLDAYEIGSKNELFDHRLRLNVSAFHYNYSDLQVTSIQNVSEITLNAAKARMDGLDLDWNVVATQRLSFGGGLSFLRAKFVSFPSGPLNVRNPASCTPVPMTTGPVTGGDSVCSANLAGYTVPHAPKFVASANAVYTIPTSSGDYAASLAIYHNSGFGWELDERLKQPSYQLLNAQLTWMSSNGKFEAKFYARNLLNDYYYSFLSEGSLEDWFMPAMPRNYGGSVSVHF
jgi:iron complex outermembrane recepter protein